MPSQEEKVAKQSFNSSVIIGGGNIVSMVFLLIASLAVARLLGPQQYGLYSLALSLPLFLQMLVGFGVNKAINRYSAYYIAKGEIATARRMTRNATWFLIICALGLTALSVALSGLMSTALLNRPGLTLYVEAASVLIFGQALYNFLTPAFVGWNAPLQDAIWTVIQAILKLAISVILIVLGFGIFGALYGYVLSCLLAGVLGTIVLFLTRLRNDPVGNEVGWTLRGFLDDVKTMMKYGLPLYTGNVILQFSQQPVITVVIAYIATNRIIGFYSAAANITQSVLAISTALTPAFFTAFASLDGMNSDTSAAFKYAVKYVSYFMMPLVMFLVATSNLLVEILYGRTYVPASYFLVFLTLAYLPYAFGYAVLIPFINGIGKTNLNLLMNIVEVLATLVPVFVLIYLLKLGVNGLLLSVVISNIPPTIFGLYSVEKYVRAKVDYVSMTKTFLVSGFCYLSLYLLSSFVLSGVSYLIAFALEALVFVALYLTLMPLSRAVGMQDIGRLRVSTHGIRFLDKFMDWILKYESFLIDHLARGPREA